MRVKCKFLPNQDIWLKHVPSYARRRAHITATQKKKLPETQQYCRFIPSVYSCYITAVFSPYISSYRYCLLSFLYLLWTLFSLCNIEVLKSLIIYCQQGKMEGNKMFRSIYELASIIFPDVQKQSYSRWLCYFPTQVCVFVCQHIPQSY